MIWGVGLVRFMTPACHVGEHGFKSRTSRQTWGIGANWEHTGLAHRSQGFESPILHQISVVSIKEMHRALNPVEAGSIPVRPTNVASMIRSLKG